MMQLGLKAANRWLPLSALPAYQSLHQRFWRRSLSGLVGEFVKLTSQAVPLTIVFPPSIDWSKQLFQRPQQMASALARQGVRVFYFQHREHWEAKAFQEIHKGLFLCSAPVEVFWELAGESLYTYAMTWNCRSAIAPNVQGIIYDHVDDLSVFPGNQARLASDHAAMVKQARLVLASAERLLDEVKSVRPDILLCPNGVDDEHFAQARSAHLQPPADLAELLADGKPLAGYVGALARWFDYPLLEAVSRARPDWHFVLIGPDHDRTLPEHLPALPNMHWLGSKPYQQLPAYLHFFDAALIPFRLNAITHAASPLKLFEYMAAGKAVVSTPIHEATRLPGVLLARDAAEFTAQLDQARLLNADSGYLARSAELARQNTWEIRARQIINALTSPSPSPGIIPL